MTGSGSTGSAATRGVAGSPRPAGAIRLRLVLPIGSLLAILVLVLSGLLE